MRPRALLRPGHVLLIAVVLGACATGRTPAVPAVAPTAGSLVIVGGAMQDTAIVRTFLDLAGGPDAPIVVIPTAGEGDDYDAFYPGLGQFRFMGADNLTVLHTRDRKVADSEAFVRPLREARAVWISGGRQWRLADSYVGTRTERELRTLLERGGVVGGSSAGASIMGSFLVRGDRSHSDVVGDFKQGFGLLGNTAIDQHLLARNRQFDLIPVIEKHPELLGIGIDENTAIVVHGNEFEVIGQGYVAIYDRGAMLDNGGRFYFLSPGDRFDLRRREAFRAARTLQPLARLERKPWPER